MPARRLPPAGAGARPRPHRQHRPQGPLGPRPAGAGHGIRRHPQTSRPAFVPADQCDRNCSFPAGHPAIGFYLVSFAFLGRAAAARRRGRSPAIVARRGARPRAASRKAGISCPTSCSRACSSMRRAGCSSRDHRAATRSRALAAGAPAARSRWRFARLTRRLRRVVCLDRLRSTGRLAQLFPRTSDRRCTHSSRFITDSASAMAVSSSPLCVPRLPHRRRLARFARARGLLRSAYRCALHLPVAVPGLVADILKPIFGRARPKLLFAATNFFGFTWGGAQADYWSFPSGHSAPSPRSRSALFMRSGQRPGRSTSLACARC